MLPEHTRDTPMASLTKFSTVSTTGTAEPGGFPWELSWRFENDRRVLKVFGSTNTVMIRETRFAKVS